MEAPLIIIFRVITKKHHIQIIEKFKLPNFIFPIVLRKIQEISCVWLQKYHINSLIKNQFIVKVWVNFDSKH